MYPATALLLLLLTTGCAASASTRFEDARPKMGTEFRIVLYAADEGTAARAMSAAWQRIDELEDCMSDYRAESEVSRLRTASWAHFSSEAIPVSKDLWNVLVEARLVSELSGGAFDVTVGPVVHLWRRAFRRAQPPDPELIAQLLKSVGYEHMQLDSSRRTVMLRRPSMRLDLGGIAKGYALDEALRVLAQHEIESALVDGGGDIAVSSAPPGELGWRIRIEGAQEFESCILANAGVATSGSNYRFVELDGVRYSHIVDPQTGLGLTHDVAASVVAHSAMRADALASAACVLGASRGLELIESLPAVEAVFHSSGKAVLAPCESSGFRRRMQLRDAP